MYKVIYKNKIEKNVRKMPEAEQKKFRLLVMDLKRTGPYQTDWSNYGKLSKDKFHCHLSHRWVACWQLEKGTITIEVYYAGSREDAPY